MCSIWRKVSHRAVPDHYVVAIGRKWRVQRIAQWVLDFRRRVPASCRRDGGRLDVDCVDVRAAPRIKALGEEPVAAAYVQQSIVVLDKLRDEEPPIVGENAAFCIPVDEIEEPDPVTEEVRLLGRPCPIAPKQTSIVYAQELQKNRFGNASAEDGAFE